MSEPTTRRRSTVHDFSTLRLHPDGSRVPISSPSRDTLNDSRTRNTGRDIRGNRVARDAAGLGLVKKRAVMREDDNDEVQNTKPRVPRHGKRRRIDDDVEFLGDFGSGVHRAGGDTTDADGEAMKWPVPSSVRSGRLISPPFFTRLITVCFLLLASCRTCSNAFITSRAGTMPRGAYCQTDHANTDTR